MRTISSAMMDSVQVMLAALEVLFSTTQHFHVSRQKLTATRAALPMAQAGPCAEMAWCVHLGPVPASAAAARALSTTREARRVTL